MSVIATHPPTRTRWRRWHRRIVRACAVVVTVPVLIVVLFHLAVAFWPYPRGLDHPPRSSTVFYDRNGVELAAVASVDETWHIPLAPAQISPHLVPAIIAVEDRRFYRHSGVDWRAAAAALWQNATALHIRRGASTLTMQVQRLRDPQARSLAGKIEQAVRACQLEKQLSKEQIVAEYLNRAPFGGNLVGAGAASRRYFGIPASDLTLAQAALLAGIPQRPAHLRPDRHPEAAAARRSHVLHCMLECGSITQQQYDAARAEPVVAAWKPLPQDRAGLPSHADGALPTLLHLAGRITSGEVRTTLDSDIQRQAAAAAGDALARLAPAQVDTIAIVVLDTSSAECRASVSLTRGLSPECDFTVRRRSTGSVLKPFIYAAAFEAGVCTPGDILIDLPAAWPGYAPNNYDRLFAGRMTAADALAESRNIPALLVLEKVGVGEAVSVMRRLGVLGLASSGRTYGLSLAIGGAESSPLEIAQAYATLGRGGLARPATCLVNPSPATGGTPVLSPSVCRATLAAISGYARTAAISPRAADLRTAWKTGTSSGHRDAWCAAVNSRYTVVVWLGNSAGNGAIALVGADAAAPVALNLIAAMISPGGVALVRTDSPRPRNAPAAGPSRAVPLSAPRIVIVSPSAGEEFVLSPDLDISRQQILFRAMLRAARAGSDPAGNLWWFLDGSPLGQYPVGEPVSWTPSPGAHEVRALDAAGRAASVRFLVRR
ncbi:MAG: penicillin-binding protein 1C [Tepidisphaerales bacterium]